MADIKVSALTAASAAAGTNELPINESGTSKKLTISQVVGFVYPVGSIYVSTVSTDPGTLFGVGTWEAFGAGRVLVGLNDADTDFDTAEETGGAKTKTIAASNLPQLTVAITDGGHTHTQDAHTHVQDTHNHAITELRDATTGGATTNIALTADTSSTLGTKVTGSRVATNQNATAVNQSATTGITATANTAGANTAISLMNPYIVVYMFKRTA